MRMLVNVSDVMNHVTTNMNSAHRGRNQTVHEIYLGSGDAVHVCESVNMGWDNLKL